MLEQKIEELTNKIGSLNERIDLLIAAYAGTENVVEKFESPVTEKEKPKKKKGRKSKKTEKLIDVPREEDIDLPVKDFSIDEEEEEFLTKEEEKEVAITEDDLRLAAKEIISCDPVEGLKKAKEILNSFGFKTLASVKKEKYPDVYHAFKNEVGLWK